MNTQSPCTLNTRTKHTLSTHTKHIHIQIFQASLTQEHTTQDDNETSEEEEEEEGRRRGKKGLMGVGKVRGRVIRVGYLDC